MKVLVSHTPIPRYGKQGVNLTGGVIEYMLSEEERKFAAAGRFDLIPTAKQRGLVEPPKEPEPLRIPREHRYVGKGRGRRSEERVTREILEKAIAEGKSQAELALELDVTPTTISLHEKRHGLKRQPKTTRHQENRPPKLTKR